MAIWVFNITKFIEFNKNKYKTVSYMFEFTRWEISKAIMFNVEDKDKHNVFF